MTTEDPLKTLATDYLNLFSNGAAFSDVVFCVEGRQVHAHRCILAARSRFFRMIFCKSEPMAELAGSRGGTPQLIPVGIVGYEVFLLLLQFLYSGQLLMVPQQQTKSKCPERGCWHSHCSAAVDLALDTLHAAKFFGVDQLSTMIQKHLATIVEKVSIEDAMRILIAAKKQGLHPLWTTCSELVARSGLNSDALRKHLPTEVAAEIAEIRLQRGYGMRVSEGRVKGTPLQEQRIRRMRQALDSLDVELVRLMVMEEGLDLDKAQALHYSVTNCSRDVVKALLEMGAVDVNYPGPGGRTSLHLACEMASPEMIAVLLDHHASPRVQSDDGRTPIGVVQTSLIAADCSPGRSGCMSSAVDHNKLRLCLELLQSAVYVADRDEEASDSSKSGVSHVRTMDPADCCCLSRGGLERSSMRRITQEVVPDWSSMESSASFEHDHSNHLFVNHNMFETGCCHEQFCPSGRWQCCWQQPHYTSDLS